MRVIASIDVDDLERAVAFYTTGLGFIEQRRLFDGSVAELRVGSVLIYLLAKASGTTPFTGSAEVRRYSRHWTPIHLDLVRGRLLGKSDLGEVSIPPCLGVGFFHIRPRICRSRRRAELVAHLSPSRFGLSN